MCSQLALKLLYYSLQTPPNKKDTRNIGNDLSEHTKGIIPRDKLLNEEMKEQVDLSPLTNVIYQRRTKRFEHLSVAPEGRFN